MEEDSKTYRERAVHARLGAREATTTQHRLIFERLAESYDKLAHDTEWLEAAAAYLEVRTAHDELSGSSTLLSRCFLG